jgi:hypothetical protein
LIRIHIHSHIDLMTQLPCKTPEGRAIYDYPTGGAVEVAFRGGSGQFPASDDTAEIDALGCPIQAKLGWGISFFIWQGSKLPHPTEYRVGLVTSPILGSIKLKSRGKFPCA